MTFFTSSRAATVCRHCGIRETKVEVVGEWTSSLVSSTNSATLINPGIFTASSSMLATTTTTKKNRREFSLSRPQDEKIPVKITQRSMTKGRRLAMTRTDRANKRPS